MQHVEVHAQIAIKAKSPGRHAVGTSGALRPQTVLAAITGPAWATGTAPVRGALCRGKCTCCRFHERRAADVADIRQCEVVPRDVSDLLLPLPRAGSAAHLRERLPQIELAIAEHAGRTQQCWSPRPWRPDLRRPIARSPNSAACMTSMSGSSRLVPHGGAAEQGSSIG